mgnify:CR=1 FL=1
MNAAATNQRKGMTGILSLFAMGGLLTVVTLTMHPQSLRADDTHAATSEIQFNGPLGAVDGTSETPDTTGDSHSPRQE